MDPRIVAICTAQGGVASVSELRAAGISSEIHRVVAKKELVRVRQRVVSPAAVSRPGPASRRWTRTPSAGGTGLRGHSCRSRSLGRSRRASLARTGVREVVELADGGSQSAGESRSRWLLHTLGSGPFITQFPVRAEGLLLGLPTSGYDAGTSSSSSTVGASTARASSAPTRSTANKRREAQIGDLGYEVATRSSASPGTTSPIPPASGSGSRRQRAGRGEGTPRSLRV